MIENRPYYLVIIEKDADGLFVASVPELPGCHTQARSIDELLVRVKEAALLCHEESGFTAHENEFVGIHKITLP